MKYSKSLSAVGYVLMATSSLITSVVLMAIGFPLALSFFLISVTFFVGVFRHPRDLSEPAVALSAIILAVLVFIAFAPFDFARSFKFTLVVLAALYFFGSFTLYISTHRKPF
ncbi:hypothetical protein [Dehalogenimonas alkenigignens]|uniref:hypothetical protein n=1 Tax=Dehalogenimonas alkenigignens TaxID=1217799 RepID=UPI0010582FA9|nr:hypothetical protein [Dehalogenimonas alkenigignens]